MRAQEEGRTPQLLHQPAAIPNSHRCRAAAAPGVRRFIWATATGANASVMGASRPSGDGAIGLDTDAIGSDLMTNALQGYAFLKIAGKGQGLDEMRKVLSARFARSRAGAGEAEPATA